MIVRLALLFVALFVLFGCNREPYSRSSSGLSALDKKVLHDFRSPSMAGKPDLQPAVERQVLSAVSRKYYTSASGCAQRRKSGGMVLNLAGATEGAFTAAGAKEIAYLVDVAECDQGTPSSINRLLVLGGGKMTATAEVPESKLLGTYDLDGDGVNELLLAGGLAGQGESTTSVRLVRFDKKALITIEDFGRVYDSDCRAFDSAGPKQRTNMKKDGLGMIETAVISYLPVKGQIPKFVLARYRAPCPAPGQAPRWVRVGEQ